MSTKKLIKALGLIIVVALMAAALPLQAKAATLCVNPTGSDGCYSSIQAAVNAASDGDTILVAPGEYEENVVVNKAITLQGAGSENTTIVATDGNATPLIFNANGATVRGFHLTHNYTQDELDDWNFNNNGVAFYQTTTGNTLSNCKVTKNRNGIYINNARNNIIQGNTIENNRTGLNLTNHVDGTQIKDNIIQNNWTIGLVYYQGSEGLPTDFNTVTVTGNSFNNNWYSEILIKNALPSPADTGTLNVTNNTFSDNPVTYTTSADTKWNEPGHDALKPVEFGGTATMPTTPLPTLRIYGVPGVTLRYDHKTLMVGASQPYTTIQSAINDASAGDTILVSGTFVHTGTATFNKDVTLTCATGAKIQVSGTGESFKLQAGASIEGCEIEKTDKTDQHNIITLEASGVAVKNNLIHGQWAIGDNEVSRAMVVYAGNNTDLEISGNEIWGLRQPAYISGTNTGTVSNNYVHGTKGWVVEGGNLTFSGNTFAGNVGDIAILSTVPAEYYTDILALSAANDNAMVEDQRVDPAVLSVAYVDDSAAAGGNGTEASPYQSIQAGINRVIAGGTVNVAAGTYTQEGALVVSTPNLTIKLSSGTVIQNSSPCFTVAADNVTITSETIGGAVCKPTGTSNGIDVTGSRVGISIIGIDFDGSSTTGGDAIDFAGSIDHFQIVNNIFHNFTGSAIDFNGTVTHNDGIQGNLFKTSTLGTPAIVVPEMEPDLNAQYNNWDSRTSPTITDVDTSNNTYASLRLESMGTPWANQVVAGQTIQYKVVADLQNVTGAAFTLSYPANLTLSATDPITLPGVFTNESVDTDTTGKLVYWGYNRKSGTDPVAVESGENIVLFTVSFTASSTGSGALTFSEDGFTMAPPSGPTNFVYTNAKTDGSVKVIDLPSLTWSDDGTPYSVGYPHNFTLTIVNPLAGGTFTPNLTFDSGNFTIAGDTAVGQLIPGGSKVLSLQITFTAAGEQQVTVRLEDPSSVPAGYDLATLTKTIQVGDAYSVFGEISMQGRTFRGNVPVLLTKLDLPVYGPFPGTTVAQLGTNLTISNLPSGSYEFTTSQARYLNITAALDKQFALGTADYTLPALMLRGGDVVDDEIIDVNDASLIGGQYGQTGDKSCDANFDLSVNIQDLALVGGNFGLTSATAYSSWMH